MRLPRRKFLHLAVGAAALPALPGSAAALDYPTHPVRWILSAAPGGAADILARLMGAWLSQRLGRQFVVESHPGAGGNIGTEAVVRAAPDGYTLHLTATSDAINATLYQNLDFSLERDLAPVAGLIRGPFVMVVTPSFPAKTVPEFIAYAKAHPGVINFGSGGVGFATHVAGELFKMLAGVNMVHVPYRGQGPAMTGLLGGQIQVLFDPVVTSLPHIQGGRLRPLAVTTAARSDVLPDVPTMADFVPGYEASIWFGTHVPKNTPAEVVDILNKETNAGLADSALKARLVQMGSTPMPMSPAEFGKFIAAEVDKWAKVVKFANIKLS
ncbi:MAG TPA: tripartite tricarboxylate transporter substrate binding protein [Xanthobacteraceae bacterium]|nr:tripartite tricarboxylate transporter substrate binding protein [Xanthobacteraceae bacterium]